MFCGWFIFSSCELCVPFEDTQVNLNIFSHFKWIVTRLRFYTSESTRDWKRGKKIETVYKNTKAKKKMRSIRNAINEWIDEKILIAKSDIIEICVHFYEKEKNGTQGSEMEQSKRVNQSFEYFDFVIRNRRHTYILKQYFIYME